MPFDVNVVLNLSIVTEINQSINLCQVGWGCPDHWSWKLMYETYDNKNTKLIIIQYISIKIIKKTTHKYIKTNENNISVNAQSNTLPHPTELIKN